MAKEPTCGRMAISTLDTGCKVNSREKGRFTSHQATPIKANGQIIIFTDEGFTPGLVEISTSESSETERKKGRGSIPGPIRTGTTEVGGTTFRMARV